MIRVAEHLKTQIQCSILPITRDLKPPHETLLVKARIKDCPSAIEKLKQQFNPKDPSASHNPVGVFDRNAPEKYSLLSLRDLVGVRVLAFPSSRAVEVDSVLRLDFSDWASDPIVVGQRLGYKYNGRYGELNETIPCEYQIVSALIGLFWEVEHAALYKQAPNLRGLAPVMKTQSSAVYRALKEFEDEFELQIELQRS